MRFGEEETKNIDGKIRIHRSIRFVSFFFFLLVSLAFWGDEVCYSALYTLNKFTMHEICTMHEKVIKQNILNT